MTNKEKLELENLKVENQSLRTAANSLKMHYEEAQAEIESLKIFRGYAEKRASDYRTMRDKYLNAKSEAYKEFAEKLKEFMHNKFKDLDEYEFEYITERDIDNFVKEMVGEDNGWLGKQTLWAVCVNTQLYSFKRCVGYWATQFWLLAE